MRLLRSLEYVAREDDERAVLAVSVIKKTITSYLGCFVRTTLLDKDELARPGVIAFFTLFEIPSFLKMKGRCLCMKAHALDPVAPDWAQTPFLIGLNPNHTPELQMEVNGVVSASKFTEAIYYNALIRYRDWCSLEFTPWGTPVLHLKNKNGEDYKKWIRGVVENNLIRQWHI